MPKAKNVLDLGVSSCSKNMNREPKAKKKSYCKKKRYLTKKNCSGFIREIDVQKMSKLILKKREPYQIGNYKAIFLKLLISCILQKYASPNFPSLNPLWNGV